MRSGVSIMMSLGEDVGKDHKCIIEWHWRTCNVRAPGQKSRYHSSACVGAGIGAKNCRPWVPLAGCASYHWDGMVTLLAKPPSNALPLQHLRFVLLASPRPACAVVKDAAPALRVLPAQSLLSPWPAPCRPQSAGCPYWSMSNQPSPKPLRELRAFSAESRTLWAGSEGSRRRGRVELRQTRCWVCGLVI